MNTLDKDIRSELVKIFKKKPEWYQVLAEKSELIKKGAWSRALIDCIYEYDWHHEADIFDVYIFLITNIALTKANSNIGAFQIPVNSKPFPDKSIIENNEVLNNLPAPFKGEFWGGTQGEDGYISWETPIHCTKCEKENENDDCHIGWCLIKPNTAQLEVGYNSSGKFWFGLDGSGLYARWPNGQKYITVFVDFNKINLYLPTDDEFNTLLNESKESIEKAIAEERSPWNRWRD